MNNDARQRLMGALSHIGYAIEVAKAQDPEGQVVFAVATKCVDGSGCLTASFDAEPFFRDVVSLLGFESPEAMLEHMIALQDGKLA